MTRKHTNSGIRIIGIRACAKLALVLLTAILNTAIVCRANHALKATASRGELPNLPKPPPRSIKLESVRCRDGKRAVRVSGHDCAFNVHPSLFIV